MDSEFLISNKTKLKCKFVIVAIWAYDEAQNVKLVVCIHSWCSQCSMGQGENKEITRYNWFLSQKCKFQVHIMEGNEQFQLVFNFIKIVGLKKKHYWSLLSRDKTVDVGKDDVFLLIVRHCEFSMFESTCITCPKFLLSTH